MTQSGPTNRQRPESAGEPVVAAGVQATIAGLLPASGDEDTACLEGTIERIVY